MTASEKLTGGDIEIENHGSLFLFRPLTTSGKDWLAAHSPEDALWWGNALVVEHRYAQFWAVEALDAGLAVR